MQRKGIKILSWSFWLIATAHIVAFTAIGLFTGAGWRLLLIFFVGIPIFLLIKKYIVKRGKHNYPMQSGDSRLRGNDDTDME